jgi:DNA-binding transcriptional MerR regulator
LQLQKYNYFHTLNNRSLNKVAENELTKLYYSIGEVSVMFGVNTSLIRFWDKEFDIITPKKNKKGNRLFTPKDIKNLNKIYDLVKNQGFTLEGARKALKRRTPAQTEIETTEESTASDDVIVKLEAIKSRLIQLKNY